MTKFELKQIIKGLITESISESKSKNLKFLKKKKKLKEQDEMEPAEPDAGEVSGPPEPQGEHADLLAQIDNIIQTLNDLKSSVQGHSQGEEEVSDDEEMGEEEQD